MNKDVPYLTTVTSLHKILDSIAKASVPDAFTFDFLKDLGFKSSNYRSFPKLLRYLGLIGDSNRPTDAYKSFVDPTQSRAVLALCLRTSFDDLLNAHPEANTYSTQKLMGWFKTKTGKSEAVATKMATTFRSLASYADWQAATETEESESDEGSPVLTEDATSPPPPKPGALAPLKLTYRVEINLPDSTNVNTFRAIFRALREELLS
ncbi:MAG: DUF5343 domain-containing protein [Acidobacteria bacterium]|nr:DUF5343 domain-containing protein [Acidobacteriota bacterium]